MSMEMSGMVSGMLLTLVYLIDLMPPSWRSMLNIDRSQEGSRVSKNLDYCKGFSQAQDVAKLLICLAWICFS